MKYLVFSLSLIFTLSLSAQFTISGVVKNNKGELLDFTTIFLEGSNYATSSDDKGKYEIKDIPKGSYSFKAMYIGYEAIVMPLTITKDTIIDITFLGEIYRLDQVEIQANRVGEYGPFTRQNLGREAINKENTGQDATFILQWTPSMVVTSDAGTGIGYSGMRLRGSDQTRINITLNDVPINDAESQNVFWVNMPDLMSSVHSVQIQRGVGPSTNGAGAFGGTVSLNTSDIKVNPFIDVAASYGSFNTRKLSAQFGSGLMQSRYSMEGRMSLIKSDGYVDRATADLNSYFFTASRVSPRSSLKLNVISGREKTYQAWNGVPEEKLDNDPQKLIDHYFINKGDLYKSKEDSINLFNSDRRYNYYTYPNQVDNYRQTHIQLVESWSPSVDWKTKFTLFYTKGKGYFEEFKPNAKWSGYGINPIIGDDGSTINRSDIVRRRWLNNYLIGLRGDAIYKVNENADLHLGISGYVYDGDHYGQVIKSSIAIPNLDKERKYYDNTGMKRDISTYMRWSQRIQKKWSLFGDVQLRYISHDIIGIDKNLRALDISNQYLFFNPKAGVQYLISSNQQVYLSYAIANKEPSRGDFIDNIIVVKAKPEHLRDTEIGYQWNNSVIRFETNIYYMKYRDQLVLTGELNEVGANIRVNVPDSYRLGWETDAIVRLADILHLNFNTTLSRNKIAHFTEIVVDYTDGFDKVEIGHDHTDISFSPSFTGAFGIVYKPLKSMEIDWSSKYVGSQFLDNTSNQNRKLNAYHFHNIRLAGQFKSKYWKALEVSFELRNIFNYLYVSNGYTYSYISGTLITQNFVYPQAGRNWIMGVRVSL